MEKTVSISIIIIACFLTFGKTYAKEENSDKGESKILKLMTYNIKFASPTFEPSWEIRRDMQIDLIRKYDPDIIGTQEGLKEQIDYLADHMPEYVVIGEGRKGGDDDEHMAIFFKRDKFRLREMQSFQLSKTPEIIGSGPEVNPRMVTWARFAFIDIPAEGKNGKYKMDYRGNWENTKEFYLFNTHYFNGRKDSLARENASNLILNRITDLNRFGEWTKERPLFLMGDFNCKPGSIPYNVLVGDKNIFDRNLLNDTNNDHNKIDWILYKGNVEVLKYEEVDYNVNGAYPSDHNPIYVEIKLLAK